MPYLFDSTMSTPLCEIMGRNKSDKGHAKPDTCKHNYTMFYYSIFKEMRFLKLRVFELGIGTNNPWVPSSMGVNGRPGASLYGWNEFFPSSAIFGADVDKDILFETADIKTFYCDQTNPSVISQMWSHPLLSDPLDIIVEDGLHEFSANVTFFEHSIHKLAVNGYYIIEDVTVNDIPLFIKKMEDWRVRFPTFSFDLVQIPNQLNSYDNNLVVIHHNTV